MKRRPYKYLLTAALLCAALTLPAKAVRRSAAVQVDGSLVTHDAYVEQGVTYVPLRALLNTLGGWRVWWDGDARAGSRRFRRCRSPGRPGRKRCHRQRAAVLRPGHGGARSDLRPPAAGM